MKIEKGKLYYNKDVDHLFKADQDMMWEDHITNKIAVHCPTKEDVEYLKSKYTNIYCEPLSKYYPDVFVKIDGDCNFDGLSRMKRDNYHIISIDQFKEFYPEEPKLSLPIVDNSNVDNIIEALKIQTQLDYSIESIERELSRLKELKQKINNILK